MSNMIPIEEAIRSNNKVIGICLLTFVILSFVAWAFTVRRERRVKKLIRRAVTKAEARTREETAAQCHEKALDNFIRWMETLRQLRITREELRAVKEENADLKRSNELMKKTSAVCPGMTAAKIGPTN
jgi:hypothetical protein